MRLKEQSELAAQNPKVMKESSILKASKRSALLGYVCSNNLKQLKFYIPQGLDLDLYSTKIQCSHFHLTNERALSILH